jgi:hypothetical protein
MVDKIGATGSGLSGEFAAQTSSWCEFCLALRTPLVEIQFPVIAAGGINGIDSVKSTTVSAEILP